MDSTKNRVIAIGQHRIVQANIMDGLDELMNGRKAAMFYSDPPWGQGTLNYWLTIHKKDTGLSVDPIEISDFLSAFFRIIIQHVEGPVIVEYGQRWKDELVETAKQFGLKHRASVTAYYGRPRRPLFVHAFTTPDANLRFDWKQWSEAVRDTAGYTTVARSFDVLAQPDRIVLDPCCGRGYTARAALDTGMIFYGSELNPARLKVTRDLIEVRSNGKTAKSHR